MNARIDPSLFNVPELYHATLPSGLRVPYVAQGTGEPLVFVHGSLCDYRYWNGQLNALSKDNLCVSPSLSHYWPSNCGPSNRGPSNRGPSNCGPSSEAEAPGEFSWNAHVHEMAAFIAAMNLGPVHLAGHSRGGCVAFHVAREYPELVKSLTLADPGGPLQIDGTPPAALPAATTALREKVAQLIGQGEIEAGLEMFVDSVSMPGIWRRSSPGFRRMATDNAGTLPGQFRDPLPAYERTAAMQVRCRTLLIEGEKSPRMYRNNAAKLAEWIPQAEKRTIAGASHGMSVTHPGSFNRLIAEFVGGA